jgi:hypothetical protein
MTMNDYAFKINILVGDLERGVLAPVDDDGGDNGGDDGSLNGSGSDSDGGAPPVVTISAQLICSSINVFFLCVC